MPAGATHVEKPTTTTLHVRLRYKHVCLQLPSEVPSLLLVCASLEGDNGICMVSMRFSSSPLLSRACLHLCAALSTQLGLVTTFTAIDLPFPVPSKSLALITSFQIPNAVESCFELDPRW